MSAADGITVSPLRARSFELRGSGVACLRLGRVTGLTGFYRYCFAGFTGGGMGQDST
jgi:hypothetical protein